MKIHAEKGFVKGLTMLVVGLGVLVVVVASLAKYTKPVNFNGFSGGSNDPFGTRNFLTNGGTQNPLLDVGQPSGSLINSGRTTTNTNTQTNTNTNTNSNTYSGTNNIPAGYSPYSKQITLSKGNTNTIQTYEENVRIRNTGNPVNITGWTLTNNKGTKPIENRQNSYFYPSQDVAIIGQGTEFLDPSGRYAIGPIVLNKNDTAIVITGGPFSQYSFPLSTSFRENICTGYLKTYPFNPALTKSCPYIKSDPAINTITDECYDYATRLGRCVDPAKDDKKRFEQQTSVCRAFLSARLNYPGCVAQNRQSLNFATNTWRVFLGQKREMWATRRETITLYDKQGLIVDQISY
jgi:hypothetical protein